MSKKIKFCCFSVFLIFSCQFYLMAEEEEPIDFEPEEVALATEPETSLVSEEEIIRELDAEEAKVLEEYDVYFLLLEQLENELANEYSLQSLYHKLAADWGRQLLQQPEEVKTMLGINEETDFDAFFHIRPKTETKKVLYAVLEKAQAEADRLKITPEQLRKTLTSELPVKFKLKKKVTIHARTGVASGYLMAIGNDKIQVGQRYILKNDIEREDAMKIYDDVRKEFVEERLKEELEKNRVDVSDEFNKVVREILPVELCKAGYLPQKNQFDCPDTVLDYAKYTHFWHERNKGMSDIINAIRKQYAVDCLVKADITRHSAIHDLNTVVENLIARFLCNVCGGSGSLIVQSTTAAAVETTQTVGMAGEQSNQSPDGLHKDETKKVALVAQQKEKGAAINVETKEEVCSSCGGEGYLVSGIPERIVMLKEKMKSLDLQMILKLYPGLSRYIQEARLAP